MNDASIDVNQQVEQLIDLALAQTASALDDHPEDVTHELMVDFIVDQVGDFVTSDAVCSRQFVAVVRALVNLTGVDEPSGDCLRMAPLPLPIRVWRSWAHRTLVSEVQRTLGPIVNA